MSIISIIGLSFTTSHVYASCATTDVPCNDLISNTSQDDEKSPPVIITQVELNSPYKPIPQDISCVQWNELANQKLVPYFCTENVVPKEAVECGYSMMSPHVCNPVHETYNFTDICSFHSGFLPNGTPIVEKYAKGDQWMVIYNIQDKPVNISNFNMKWNSTEFHENYDANFSLTLSPHEQCLLVSSFVESTTGTALIQYNYQGNNYVFKTPQLVDVYHDLRIWKFDGNKWIFTDNSIPTNTTSSSQLEYPPFNEAYSNNPVIITQVELATPLQSGNQSGTDCTVYPNDTKVCQSYHSPYSKDVHSPYYNIQCAFFGGTCQLMHQIENLDNQCDSLQNYHQGTQWIEVYNQMNSTAYLTHFGVIPILNEVLHIRDMPPQYAGIDYVGYINFTMLPHQHCSYGFIAGPIGSALEFPLNDTSLAVVYDQDGVHHTVATPFLADTYNDTKTWQYDGNKWVFAEQNTVKIPEFDTLTIPVMLIGIASVIAFYRMKFRK